MSSNIKKLPQEKKDQLLLAVLNLADGEPSLLLEDVELLFTMAMEHYLMNDPETRGSVYLSYRHLHDLLAVMDMVFNEREGCRLMLT